ncbi:lipid II flippase Amj family protein [Clostridium hydrogenum]|uniref:lipid II flippase Amj family protein n=1 Tax=Clostridium hydrogenum TaxID=2855764 RepID=UPI001F395B93|nr:lipid II flippase Amj family protein [Clostridium hydrogenum]
MNLQILLVLIFNFIIAIIGTLAYSVRLVGVRTGKIAISFTVFNILSLISRTAVTFQEPLLTNYVEKNLYYGNLLHIFDIIILNSGIAAAIGAFLIPTFQKIFSKGVMSFSVERSIPRLLLNSISKSGMFTMKNCITAPCRESVTELNYRKLPRRVVVYNFAAVALITVGALAPIYAFRLAPDLRATCGTLSSVVNGIATILMTLFIDPQMSIMTEDVMDGKCTQEDFKSCVVAMVGSKVLGTFAAVFLLIPGAYAIVFAARGINFISRF